MNWKKITPEEADSLAVKTTLGKYDLLLQAVAAGEIVLLEIGDMKFSSLRATLTSVAARKQIEITVNQTEDRKHLIIRKRIEA